MFKITADTSLSKNMKKWIFIGDGNGDAPWKQDHNGIIYPPTWSNPRFNRGLGIPDFYAHDLAKEDYAFLTSYNMSDIDISVKFKYYFGSVINGGIVFRAVDSTRFYILDIVDLGRKASQYELSLWLQESNGYRKLLAKKNVWHSVVAERLVQGFGLKTIDDWNNSSPDWITIRVQATGTYIRVSVDGNVAFDLRDSTYAEGYVGLVARSTVCFRDLVILGNPGEKKEMWKVHEGEMPPEYFIPGSNQPVGRNAFPAVCCTNDGSVLTVWASNGGETGRTKGFTNMILFTKLKEGETEWSKPINIYDLCSNDDTIYSSNSIYCHKNGEITCLVNVKNYILNGTRENITFCMRSRDQGRSWSNDGILEISRKTSDGGNVYLYSPMRRLSDGRVVMTGYEVNDSRGDDNSKRCDRSLLYISHDDGYTWDEPLFFDSRNFDHNECMVVETEPGKLIAFMRTLREKNMWFSSSEDGGMTWTSLKQSDISGECIYMIRHSSGALVLFYRMTNGSSIRLSFDNGSTWTKDFRISPAAAMVGMDEMKDGRIVIIMHEGYRTPGKIRGQFFRVTSEGPVPA